MPPTVTTNRIQPTRIAGRKITFPVPSVAKPVAVSPQAPAPVATVAASIPAPAPKLDAPDVAVVLEVGDFVDRLPPNFLNPGPFDRHHKIEFRASELYSDLTKGRASVPASTIYAKYPSIFARPVSDTEDVEVSLPLQKLVEQLSAAFHTRTDQVAEENVGEIETPFLQVAKEDSERLPTAVGTVAGAIRPAIPLPPAPPVPAPGLAETVPNFPVRPQHRTGQISTISAPRLPIDAPVPPAASAIGSPATGPINPGKRPPSTVRASVAGGKIRLSGPSAVTRMSAAPIHPIAPGAAGNTPPPSIPPVPSTSSQRIQLPSQGGGPAASPSLAVSKKTARIQIPPISLRAGGQGAQPRPGTATPPPSVPVQPSPVSIHPPAGTDLPVTFRSSPPPPSAKLPPSSFAPAPRSSFPPPSFPGIPPAAVPLAAAPVTLTSPAPTPADDRKIELGLAAVLRGLPSEVLAVEPYTIADDVRLSLPFASVEKQLSVGRVSIGVEAFVQALPENYRHVLTADSGLTEILLPLPEIFQNLPGSALAIRADQIVEETGTLYPTPFSQKADEDAQRFNISSVPAPQTEPTPTPELVANVASTAVADAVPTESPAAPVVEDGPSQVIVADQLPAPVELPGLGDEFDRSDVLGRDIPLDPDENLPTEPFPTERITDTKDAVTEARVEVPTVATPAVEIPAVVNDLPAEPVVEPPAVAEPVPVAEALAVLESTAPAETVEPVIQTPEAVVQPAPEPAVAAPAALDPKPAVSSPTVAQLKGRDSALQTLFMTEEELDARAVVRLVCSLPGVTGCAVMFADGLRLAGNFPEGDAEGFSAMAPPFYKRTQNFVSELKLGGLKTFTVYTEKDLLSFFMHDDICLSVRHSGRGFLPGVREKLETVTRELAGMYSTAKVTTTDYSL